MNPLLILSCVALLTGALFLSSVIAEVAEGKKMKMLIFSVPLILGAIVYASSFATAQFVYRDALAATRTVHTEWELSGRNAPSYEAPDFGNDYASLVKYGQLGTTKTVNGYDVTMELAENKSFKATVAKDGQVYSEVTLPDYIRFNEDQKWVNNYPFVFQSGI